MRRPSSLAVVPLMASLLVPGASGSDGLFGYICRSKATRTAAHVRPATTLPLAHCSPVPTGFQELPSVGTGGDVSVDLSIAYDQNTDRLCYSSIGLPAAPVIHVGVGHQLSIQLTNTLQDTGTDNEANCPIQVFGGSPCLPELHFAAAPGPDGSFYPIEANQSHEADGMSNLHVHGLFVSPLPCSDEVLESGVYPANWEGPVTMTAGCQTTPWTLTYTYSLPADHPAGLYWYHSHRHGESEQETQMGLAGAIVVEDAGDAWRRSIGVTDEVLVIDDKPQVGCVEGITCDALVQKRQPNKAAARAKARAAEPVPAYSNGPILDLRIDQVDQAGECAAGATGSGEAGGTQLWTLTLNGAAVAENADGSFPADSQVLTKTMQPGQRQIFRMVNASADSFVAPRLTLVRGRFSTVLPLEVFARDGVGLANAAGTRHLGHFDVAHKPFIVPPAGRVEFVVHAPPPGAKLYLDSGTVYPGCGGKGYPARRLLLITPSGSPVDPGAWDDTDLLQNTPSLAPYFATLAAAPTVHRTIVLAEYTRGFTYGVTDWLDGTPGPGDYNADQTDFYIPVVASNDGEVDRSETALVPFTADTSAPQVTVHLHGQQSVTETWLVENSTLEIHAFHMHQIHFRDVTAGGTNLDDQPILDTVTVPAAPLVGDVATGHPGAPGWVKLRMTFTTQDIGEFVFHCHILEHEDNGMMAKIAVVAD